MNGGVAMLVMARKITWSSEATSLPDVASPLNIDVKNGDDHEEVRLATITMLKTMFSSDVTSVEVVQLRDDDSIIWQH